MRKFCSSKSTTEGLFLHSVWCLVRYMADSPNPVPGLEHFWNRVWCEHYNWQLLMSHRITRDSLFILETFRYFFQSFTIAFWVFFSFLVNLDPFWNLCTTANYYFKGFCDKNSSFFDYKTIAQKIALYFVTIQTT